MQNKLKVEKASKVNPWKVVQKKKNARMLSLSCIILIVAVAAVASPFVVMYWDEIVDFFQQMLPPPVEAEYSSGGPSEAGST